MSTADAVINGLCADCGEPVVSGTGVTVDPEGQVWHSDCRRMFNRKNKTQEPAKRGPGRPRKNAEEAS